MRVVSQCDTWSNDDEREFVDGITGLIHQPLATNITDQSSATVCRARLSSALPRSVCSIAWVRALLNSTSPSDLVCRTLRERGGLRRRLAVAFALCSRRLICSLRGRVPP